MSEENVEIVRRGNALLNAGDLDGAFALWREDAEYRDLQHGPDMPEVFNGREGLQQVAALWTDVYDDFGAEVYEYIDADPWVVCDTRWYGRGKGSEATAEQRLADAYELRDGKIVRGIMSYPDVATALADLGLEAQAMPEQSATPDAVALTHGVADAASRRDFDALARFWTPDGVWDMTPMGMGVFEGHEAIHAFMADWIGAYEDFEVKAEEIRDLGNGVAFAVLAQRGRPFDSNGFIHLRYASVTTWRNGLVQRSTQYTDIDEARAAAERLAQELG